MQNCPPSVRENTCFVFPFAKHPTLFDAPPSPPCRRLESETAPGGGRGLMGAETWEVALACRWRLEAGRGSALGGIVASGCGLTTPVACSSFSPARGPLSSATLHRDFATHSGELPHSSLDNSRQPIIKV